MPFGCGLAYTRQRVCSDVSGMLCTTSGIQISMSVFAIVFLLDGASIALIDFKFFASFLRPVELGGRRKSIVFFILCLDMLLLIEPPVLCDITKSLILVPVEVFTIVTLFCKHLTPWLHSILPVAIVSRSVHVFVSFVFNIDILIFVYHCLLVS